MVLAGALVVLGVLALCAGSALAGLFAVRLIGRREWEPPSLGEQAALDETAADLRAAIQAAAYAINVEQAGSVRIHPDGRVEPLFPAHRPADLLCPCRSCRTARSDREDT